MTNNIKISGFTVLNKLKDLNFEMIPTLNAVNRVNKFCEDGLIKDLDELKKDYKLLNLKFPKKTKTHHRVRYSLMNDKYIRDQYGEYVYSAKFKKFVKMEHKHKESKKEKQEKIDAKRNDETTKFEEYSDDEPLAKGLPKVLNKAGTKVLTKAGTKVLTKPRSNDSSGRLRSTGEARTSSDKIAGGIVISDEAIEMANKYI